jgi:AcrR family transcriptional regulator
MRYPPDHKAKAREALLQAGMRSMKTAGFNGIGVDGLAAEAGVTSGAFYSNFRNKEAMLEAIIDTAVAEPFLSDTETASKAEVRRQLRKLLDVYLADEHVANSADGCPMPALCADVARAGMPTREAYERKITAWAHRIADCLDGVRSDRERRAWGILSLMVGAITISRAMSDPAMQTEVVSAARRTAERLVTPPKTVSAQVKGVNASANAR